MPTGRKKNEIYNQPSSAGKNQLAQTILNSLSAHVAILDENGFILETNRAWMAFAEANQIRMRPDTLKVNYLEICDSADGYSADESSSVAKGIRDVIAGKIESSKEIAAHMHLSLTTINFHRRNLRRKLNLRNSRINLRTYLLSLTE